MNKTLTLAIMTLFFTLLQPVYAADISPEKRALINTILEQTKQTPEQISSMMATQFTKQITTILKSRNNDINPKILESAADEVNSVIREEVVEKGGFTNLIYPIYDQYFTTEELKEMVAFNNTKLGKKLLVTMPKINQNGLKAGQKLGASLGPKINARLEERFKKDGFK